MPTGISQASRSRSEYQEEVRTNICYSHTFDNNLGIKRKFTKYLKESCCLAADQHFSFIVFSEYAFVS